MNNREQRLERAVKLLCDWTGTDPKKRNTVISMGVADLLDGKDESPAIAAAFDLAARQVESRGRKIGA